MLKLQIFYMDLYQDELHYLTIGSSENSESQDLSKFWVSGRVHSYLFVR
jgi:hypothetical protein